MDESLFSVEYVESLGNAFVIVKTEADLKVGEYQILYRVSLADYPSNLVESEQHFTVTVQDACAMEEHNSIEASQLNLFSYTLTDTSKTYELEPFTTDLDWCKVTYTYTIDSMA